MKTVPERYTVEFILLCLFCLFFCVPFFAHAQLGGLTTGMSLAANPRYPGPHSAVTVALNAYSMNTTGATIRWYLDGTERVEFKNMREITITTGDLGVPQKIRASIALQTGDTAVTDLTLTPGAVDIIVEADTVVPAFYRGRALPSSGAAIRAIAVPHGGSQKANTYTYLWKLDNKVLFGGPILGGDVVEMTMPPYGGLLSVSVIDGSGDTIAQQAKSLELMEPEVYFYEENPLRGLSRKTVGETYTLVGDEVTIAAVPYFMSKNTDASSRLYEWRINNTLIENPSEDQSLITLRKEGGGGTANVAFKINDTKNLLQFTRGSFNIFFE